MTSKNQLLLLTFIVLLLPLLAIAQGGPIKSKRFTGFNESDNPSYSYSYELKYQLQSTNYGNRPTAIKLGISNFTIKDFRYDGNKAKDVLGTGIFGNCRVQADVSGQFHLQSGQKMLRVEFMEPAVSDGGLDLYYFTKEDINNIKGVFGESITYDDLDIVVMIPKLSNLAVGKVAEIQNAMNKAKQTNFQKKLDAEMAKEKQRVKDELRIQEKIAQNTEEERKKEEIEAEKQQKLDEMLSNPSNYTNTYTYSGSSSSTYSSQRASLQRDYNNLLKRHAQERKNTEAMGQAIGDVVMSITNSIIEDSKRREAQRQADAERQAIIQKQTNLRLKEELKSHNTYMNDRIDVLESSTYSLSNMLRAIETKDIKEVYIVLVNYNSETKRPRESTIDIPYKHLHVSYFEEPVKMPVTEIYTTEYKKYIDNFNLFYVESLDVGEPVTRQSYYFKTKTEAENFIILIENLKDSREDFVSWTTITTENYNPLNFSGQVGRNIQKDKPYEEIVSSKIYDKYDPSNEITEREEITTTQSVIDRYWNIVLGEEDILSIKTFYTKAKLTVEGGILEVETKCIIDKFGSITFLMNGIEVVKEVSNGKEGYMIQNGVRSNITKDRMKSLISLNLISKPKSDNIEGNAKKVKIDGIKAYRVKYNGDKQFYSRDTGLLIKSIANIKPAEGLQGVEKDEFKGTITIYDDYRDVIGFKVPFKNTIIMDGLTHLYEYKIIKINEGVKKSDFKM
ncbi:hypothetical protein [Flavicella sediminum]|uniref:hypothetical protein n=1 Tax=Flavicella sediminum TaxID=2585141 RepID=UPI00111D10E3|nr:hypothetical protein [Flavicella sediminum]